MDAAEVAAYALEGVKHNLLHIFAHPDSLDRIKRRHATLLSDHQLSTTFRKRICDLR